MKKPRVAIIYRSPLGAVAGYGKNGQRLFFEGPGVLANKYWEEHSGSVNSYKTAQWVDSIQGR